MDATACGVLAASDGGCNPDIVFVRTEAPFCCCYCAAIGDSCASRGLASEYAVFQKQEATFKQFVVTVLANVGM